MRANWLQSAIRMLAVLAVAMSTTGCIWFDWNHHHHHDRYGGQGIRYAAPEQRYSAREGGLILPVTWQGPAVATTASESQAMPNAGGANCVCGEMCASTCGANCPKFSDSFCPARRNSTLTPLPSP